MTFEHGRDPPRGGNVPKRLGRWVTPLADDAAHLETIEQSHERCAAFGLASNERPDFDPLGRSDLNVARERNQRLYTHAAPVMELLFEQVINSHSMVVLTDAQGTILHSVGDNDFLERAEKVALMPGVNWAEHTRGTNAIGTALIHEDATLVHADEHFIRANHFLTCSAAPIFDPRGNILGTLDVTGDHRSYHRHTMGLVKMSARMIENHWFNDHYHDGLRLHFHVRPEFIGTLMEGIVAVGRDGRILGANRAALDLLSTSGAALRMGSLASVFGTSVSALVDHFRSPMATLLPLTLPSGGVVHARCQVNWSPMLWRGEAPEAARTAPEAGGPAPDEGSPLPAAAGRAGSGAAAGPAGGLPQATPGLKGLQSGDPQMAQALEKLRRVIDRDIPILLMGETGTGKELVAHAIHQDSRRARQPFVAVNCASIPETLIEAELFGYEEGAFTGAKRRGAPGKIVQAHGGTLFLDEIGDMPLPLQARLLRVLQERQVMPLGSVKSVPIDIAVVCATHRNLREMIARGAFREDLYYRLNGLVVKLPPLRQRSDLNAIVSNVLRAKCPGRPMRLAPDVAAMFTRYQWPGNIRQLISVLHAAVVMAGDDTLITVAHLSDDFLEDAAAPATSDEAHAPLGRPTLPPMAAASSPVAYPAAGSPAREADAGRDDTSRHVAPSMPGAHHRDSASFSQALPTSPQADLAVAEDPTPVPEPASPTAGRTLDELELDAIRRAVDEAGGNISVASKRLGISRNTIYRKLRWKQPSG